MPGPVSSILNITCFRYVIQYPQLHVSITFQSNCWCWQFCSVAAACHYDLITASISLNNVDIVTSLFPPTQTQTVTRDRDDGSQAQTQATNVLTRREEKRKEAQCLPWRKRKVFRLEGPLLSLIRISGAYYFISPLANTQNNETMMSSCQSLGF